jgi:hypothetical protein
VEVDQIHEAGHRRIMRSWSAVGERGLALQHYRRLGQWLAVEMDSDPEPETRSLAEELQASYPEEPGRQMQIGHALTFASPPPAFSGITASRPAFVPAVPAHRFRMSALLRPAELVMSLLIAMGLLLASSLTPSRLLDADQISVIPGEGQPFIPAGGGLPLALHRGVLSHFPDWESVDACLNWRSGMIARVDGVPGPVAVRALPSVLEHPWLNGSSLVTTDAHPSITYAVVGCVKSPVDQGTPAMQSRPGPALPVPASVLESLPTGTRLETPIRPAGTVIRVKGRSEMRLVLYGGGALSVPSARVLASHCRSGTAEVDSAEFAFYRVVGRLRAASTGCPTQQP